jgi:hypothetical protein
VGGNPVSLLSLVPSCSSACHFSNALVLYKPFTCRQKCDFVSIQFFQYLTPCCQRHGYGPCLHCFQSTAACFTIDLLLSRLHRHVGPDYLFTWKLMCFSFKYAVDRADRKRGYNDRNDRGDTAFFVCIRRSVFYLLEVENNMIWCPVRLPTKTLWARYLQESTWLRL